MKLFKRKKKGKRKRVIPLLPKRGKYKAKKKSDFGKLDVHIWKVYLLYAHNSQLTSINPNIVSIHSKCNENYYY